MSIERRRHQRHSLRISVRVKVPEGHELRGYSVNLSATGALIALPDRLTLGVEMPVTFVMSDDENDVMTVKCLPVWQDKPGGSPPFMIGLHFTLVTAEQQQRFREIVFSQQEAQSV